MKVIIFAGAKINDYGFCKEYMTDADAIICCDAGMAHAKALGIDPDYIVGDFDSTSSDVLEYYKGKNIPIRQFPTRKDETDMELGIFLALELGAEEPVLRSIVKTAAAEDLQKFHAALDERLAESLPMQTQLKSWNEGKEIIESGFMI